MNKLIVILILSTLSFNCFAQDIVYDKTIKQYIIAEFSPIENNIDNSKRGKIQQEHIEYIKSLAKNGKLVLAGPYFDGGGLFFLNTSDETLAKNWIEKDPTIKNKINSYSLKKWFTEKGLFTLDNMLSEEKDNKLDKKINVQNSDDSNQIKETVLKYIESFYLTQPEKGQESIHPLLAKRTIKKFGDGSEFLKRMSYEEMKNLGKVFNSKGKYNKNSKKEIVILDMMDKTASVKLVAEAWVDYLHLGKINGEWKIINILWQMEK